jgi:hypothetical protein
VAWFMCSDPPMVTETSAPGHHENAAIAGFVGIRSK